MTASYTPERAWLERVDRVEIDGTEYAAACNGLVEVDAGSDLITAFRDHVDLGEWRTRIGEALRR